MLMPKRMKHRKPHRPKPSGKAGRGNTVAFGDWGLQALECTWVTARQIEAARIAITRCMKRGGKVWIRIFPASPITKKPAETRMGKGKGAIEEYVAPVKAGKVMFEVAGVKEDLAKRALRLAAFKLTPRTKIIGRHVLGGAA
jgi:large subunit ribosomal protein L16